MSKNLEKEKTNQNTLLKHSSSTFKDPPTPIPLSPGRKYHTFPRKVTRHLTAPMTPGSPPTVSSFPSERKVNPDGSKFRSGPGLPRN